MIFDGMAISMAAMAISFVRGEQPGPCPSGTVTLALTSTDGVKPLNDALKCSGSGFFDVTLLAPLQIEETIEISDQKNVTVTASVDNELGGTNDDSSYVEIDAGYKTGIFSVSNGSTLNIIKLILVGGYSADGGAVAVTASSSLNVFDCIFTNNRASNAGGGISADQSYVSIIGEAFFANNSAGFGGAIFGNQSSIDIDATSSYWQTFIGFVNNSADVGGAIAADDSHISAESDFDGNSAEIGGAIYIAGRKHLSAKVIQSDFDGNTARHGGAIYFDAENGTLAVTAGSFLYNHARVSGGAIYFNGGLNINGGSFIANSAGEDGLAIGSSFCDSSWVELKSVSFIHNGLYCPSGLYQQIPINGVAGPSVFDTVCNGCSSVPNSVPGGVDDHSQWLLPLCEDPPIGTFAPSNGTSTTTLSLEEGYYRGSKTSEDIGKCYRYEACVGGNDSDNYCAVGYMGAYCSACQPEYSLGIGYSCLKCSGEEKRMARGVAAVVVAAVLLASLVLLRHMGRVVVGESTERLTARQGFIARKMSWFKGMATKSLPLTTIKIVVVVWQIIFQFSALAEDVFPEEYEQFLSYISFVDFDISVIGSYSCTLRSNFYIRLGLATITPISLLAVLALAYYIAKRRYKNSPQCIITVRRRHLHAGLFIVFFVYSSVSSTVLQAFACEADYKEDKTLRADHSLRCDRGVHGSFVTYAAVMVLIYPIGIPAFFCWWLLRNRKYLKAADRDTIVHLQPFCGVWSTYCPSRYYFELVEYCRRLTLSMSSVFLVANSVDHIAIVLSLAVVFMFLSESLSPFQKSVDMGLYRWGNGIILASMYIALLMKAKESDGDFRALSAFGWLLIAANIVMIAVVVLEAVTVWGGLKESMPRVEQVDSPAFRPTLVTLKSINPSPMLDGICDETKVCDMSGGDEGYIVP